MMARSCHRTQFGRCELVGGGKTWHTLQHDDDDHDDHEGGDDNLDFDNDALQHGDAIEDGAFGYCDNTDVDGSGGGGGLSGGRGLWPGIRECLLETTLGQAVASRKFVERQKA